MLGEEGVGGSILNCILTILLLTINKHSKISSYQHVIKILFFSIDHMICTMASVRPIRSNWSLNFPRTAPPCSSLAARRRVPAQASCAISWGGHVLFCRAIAVRVFKGSSRYQNSEDNILDIAYFICTARLLPSKTHCLAVKPSRRVVFAFYWWPHPPTWDCANSRCCSSVLVAIPLFFWRFAILHYVLLWRIAVSVKPQ